MPTSTETTSQPPAPEPAHWGLINRREAIRRVTLMLGGVALVGGNALLTGCRDRGPDDAVASEALFTDEEIAYLDEVADTMLPETSTPGAKAAGVGPFMALMVTDTYHPPEQQVFREGLTRIEQACQAMHDTGFMQATPEQRLALLQQLDQEQVDYTRRREEARSRQASPPQEGTDSAGGQYLPDQRQQNATGADADATPAITADAPAHYFRMMKELALLGYFTSEIGYTQAMRYRESPGRFDPCVPYTPGETIWAPHA